MAFLNLVGLQNFKAGLFSKVGTFLAFLQPFGLKTYLLTFLAYLVIIGAFVKRMISYDFAVSCIIVSKGL